MARIPSDGTITPMNYQDSFLKLKNVNESSKGVLSNLGGTTATVSAGGNFSGRLLNGLFSGKLTIR